MHTTVQHSEASRRPRYALNTLHPQEPECICSDLPTCFMSSFIPRHPIPCGHLADVDAALERASGEVDVLLLGAGAACPVSSRAKSQSKAKAKAKSQVQDQGRGGERRTALAVVGDAVARAGLDVALAAARNAVRRVAVVTARADQVAVAAEDEDAGLGQSGS